MRRNAYLAIRGSSLLQLLVISSYRFILFAVLLHELTVFFLQITVWSWVYYYESVFQGYFKILYHKSFVHLGLFAMTRTDFERQ